MSRREYKADDKITYKMSRDGLVEKNEATGEEKLVSQHESDLDLRGNLPEPLNCNCKQLKITPAQRRFWRFPNRL